MRRSVLHVITCLHDGGAEAVLYRICTHDDTYRHHVVSLMGPGKYGPLLASKGIPVTCLDMPKGRITLRGLFRLWRVIRTTRPDVVQTWMYHADLVGGIIARLSCMRNVVWGIRNTTLSLQKSTRGTIRVAHLCARISKWVPRHILCCAEKAREVHVSLGYDARKMRVVSNGYDLSLFRPEPVLRKQLRDELGIPSETPVIGFVARFDPQKNHSGLLQACSILREKDVQPICLLVGAGVDDENIHLVEQIEALGLSGQVRLLGQRTDIPAVMNAIDLYVMSSVYGEAFPNALAEAMACGTPCVSTDVGDAAMILGDTGWVVPPRDTEALATALLTALAEAETSAWQARRQAARTRIESRFTIGRMVEGFHAVWHD